MSSDPVASSAQQIISHMNKDHVKEMITIVAHRVPSLPNPPEKARMISIDSTGFTIEYKFIKSLFWNPKGEKKKVRVPFSPKIENSENIRKEIRERIIEISKESQIQQQKKKKLYKIRYSVPRDLPIWILIHLAFFAISYPQQFDKFSSNSPISLNLFKTLFDQIRQRLPNGARSATWLHNWIMLAHVGEASLMAFYSFNRGARGSVWIKWIFTHLVVGFTTYFNFNKLNPKISP